MLACHNRLFVLEHTTQLLQSRAHLCFDRTYGAASQFRYFLVGQVPILTQQKNSLLFGTQPRERRPKVVQALLLRQLGSRKTLARRFGYAAQGPGASAPGTTLKVL